MSCEPERWNWRIRASLTTSLALRLPNSDRLSLGWAIQRRSCLNGDFGGWCFVCYVSKLGLQFVQLGFKVIGYITVMRRQSLLLRENSAQQSKPQLSFSPLPGSTLSITSLIDQDVSAQPCDYSHATDRVYSRRHVLRCCFNLLRGRAVPLVRPLHQGAG